MIPPAEQHLAIGQDCRIEIVTLVERDLVYVAAIVVHHVQDEGRFVPVLVLGIELGLALIQQHGL